jgi:hypothetical protein
MKYKNLIFAALVVTLPQLANAGPYPWKKPDKDITSNHKSSAAQLKEALNNRGLQYPIAKDPYKAKWSKKRYIQSISNVDIGPLNKLFVGHYFVSTYQPWKNSQGANGNLISVRYYSKDGTNYSCIAQSKKRYLKDQFNWKVIPAYAGFAGRTTSDKPIGNNLLGYSVVYEQDTGMVLYYKSGKGKKTHEKFEGHFQKEYAPVFAEICPNIPNNGNVNSALTSRKYDEFVAQGAKPITGVPVVFKQDISDPLTLGKYFSLYPPTAK